MSLNLIPEADDGFAKLADLLPKPPVDYWDFPSVMLACAEAPKGSELFVTNNCFFRKRNKSLRLLSWLCPISILETTCADLMSRGYAIDTVYFVHKELGFDNFQGCLKKVRSYNEFYVTNEYDFTFPHLSGKHASTLRRKIRQGHETFDVYWDDKPKKEESVDLVRAWAKSAKKRHWMIATGPYIRFVERYYQNPHNVRLITFKRRLDGLFYGIAGYELFGDRVNILVMKHLFDYSFFPQFFWTTALKTIFEKENPSKIFCGGTADHLKRELGFIEEKSFKLVIK